MPDSTTSRPAEITIQVRRGDELLARLEHQTRRSRSAHPAHDLRWLGVLSEAFGHVPILLEAFEGGRRVGQLPLALVRSLLFGRFLVSLPYLNSAGVDAESDRAARGLIGRAVSLTDAYRCRYLELRHERHWDHPALSRQLTSKVHMRRNLQSTREALWADLTAKVRNQVRKGEKYGFSVQWGGRDLLDGFYAVFSHNMRDLGTPVYGRQLFVSILNCFPKEAEFCLLQDGRKPVAGALLLHGGGITEVPSASSLRAYNRTNANMLMYWHLLERAVGRGQQQFDFGRSSRDSSTFRFKKQWGAEQHPAIWQYYLRRGRLDAMRPDSGRNQKLIRVWQRLPVPLTRWIGPSIIRGVP